MGDVAERSRMDEDGRVLERLQQVRFDRVAHDDRHRSGRLQLLGRHRLAGFGVADDDPAHPLAQVAQRPCQGQHRHDLRRSRDVEARLARHAVLLGAEPADDAAERAVVDVEHPLPRDAVRVEPERVAAVEMVVHHGGQQVVRRSHRVEVAGEVQVQVLEGDDLAVAATGGATLDPEGRSHGGLTDGDGRPLPDAGERLPEADRRRGLSLPERGRGDGRDHDVAGGRAVRQGVHGVEADLGDGRAVRFEQRSMRCPCLPRRRQSA